MFINWASLLRLLTYMEEGIVAEETPGHCIKEERVDLLDSEEYVDVDVVDKECSKDDYSPQQFIDV